MTGRLALLVGTVAVGACTFASPALADFHFMLIQEIAPASPSNPDQDYVQLQMYEPGQNAVGGHTLTLYAANGTVADTATFPPAPGGNVANGQDQATILIGAAGSVFGEAPDLMDAGLTALDPGGGAACWENIDCVSWGTFTPPIGGLPSPAGTPVLAPDGFGDGDRAVRTIQAGCETTLDAVDDTNDGQDFAIGFPVPRNNATPPTEEACFNTAITSGPEGRTRKRRPTFEFTEVPAGDATFRCAVDDPDLSDTCTSPHQLPRQSLGKHKFFVWAVNSQNGADPTPAKRAFKVIRRR